MFLRDELGAFRFFPIVCFEGEDEGKGGGDGLFDKGGDGGDDKKGDDEGDDKGKGGDDQGDDKKGDHLADDKNITARPDNIPEQFWNAETGEPRIDAMLKSQKDTKTELDRLKGQQVDAPKDAQEYTADHLDDAGLMKLPDGIENIEITDESDAGILNDFADYAMDKGWSKKVFDEAMEFLFKAADPLMAPGDGDEDKGEEWDRTKAKEELGENAEALIGAMQLHYEKYESAGNATEDDTAYWLNALGHDTRLFQIANKYRVADGGQAMPGNLEAMADEQVSREEWYAMRSDPQYDKSPEFRAKYDRIGAKLWGEAPAGASITGHGMPQSSSAVHPKT